MPVGNSPDKNRAMTAFGADLVENGNDCNGALEFARHIFRGYSLRRKPGSRIIPTRTVASGRDLTSTQKGTIDTDPATVRRIAGTANSYTTFGPVIDGAENLGF